MRQENKDVSSFFILCSKDDLHKVTFNQIIEFACAKSRGPRLDFLADEKRQVKAALGKYGVDLKIINDPSKTVLEKEPMVFKKLMIQNQTHPKLEWE